MGVLIASIVLSVVIFSIGILLFYYYLEWNSNIQNSYQMYKFLPSGVSHDDTEKIDKYKYFILPDYLSDTFKALRFNIIFLWHKILIL